MMYWVRRLIRLLSGKRYESITNHKMCRARILTHCKFIANAARITSDTFELQNIRDANMHEIEHRTKLLAVEFGLLPANGKHPRKYS